MSDGSVTSATTNFVRVFRTNRSQVTVPLVKGVFFCKTSVQKLLKDTSQLESYDIMGQSIFPWGLT